MSEIRAESPTDRQRIFEVEAAAFGRDNEAQLVDVLRGSAQPQISLVALLGDRIVGHIFFSPVTIGTQPDAPRCAGLGPVAVDPAHQGHGLGGALIRAGLERCPSLGWQAVFLVGNPAYYSRFGFALAGVSGLNYGDPQFDPVFQMLELDTGSLDGWEGRVLFHPAFAGAE